MTPSGRNPLNRDDFPRLVEFARGYLHQDVVPEYGSPLEAARAYLGDLQPAERKEVAEQGFRFRRLVRGWTAHEVNDALAKLGAAWKFGAMDEVNAVLEVLERGH